MWRLVFPSLGNHGMSGIHCLWVTKFFSLRCFRWKIKSLWSTRTNLHDQSFLPATTTIALTPTPLTLTSLVNISDHPSSPSPSLHFLLPQGSSSPSSFSLHLSRLNRSRSALRHSRFYRDPSV